MKQTTLYVAACLAITILLVQPPRVSSTFEVDFKEWLARFQAILDERIKKECVGYMCSYTHMGSAAAVKTKHRALMGFLQDCARDPNCSPGKRRKRSVSTKNSLSRYGSVAKSLALKNLFPRTYAGFFKRNRKENVNTFNLE